MNLSSDKVLYEVSTKGFTFLFQQVLEITDRGINYSNRGLFSLFQKTNVFIPYDQISAFEVSKLILGLQVDLVITSTSGKILRMKDVNRAQAEEATNIIYQTKERILNNKMKNDSERKNNLKEITGVADQLQKLASLKEAGIITEEEFEVQKKKLLDT